jgi:hypothetical protein
MTSTRSVSRCLFTVIDPSTRTTSPMATLVNEFRCHKSLPRLRTLEEQREAGGFCDRSGPQTIARKAKRCEQDSQDKNGGAPPSATERESFPPGSAPGIVPPPPGMFARAARAQQRHARRGLPEEDQPHQGNQDYGTQTNVHRLPPLSVLDVAPASLRCWSRMSGRCAVLTAERNMTKEVSSAQN